MTTTEMIKGKKVIVIAEIDLFGASAKGIYNKIAIVKKVNGSKEYNCLRNKNTGLLELSDCDKNMRNF